jgi:hypothetical protein
MSRKLALVLIGLLGSLVTPASAYAQLTPPAGSAGAGNSAISGVPFGPANPSVLSDPSGIGNASRIPPLGRNSPPPPVAYGSVGSPPPRVAAPYAGAVNSTWGEAWRSSGRAANQNSGQPQDRRVLGRNIPDKMLAVADQVSE